MRRISKLTEEPIPRLSQTSDINESSPIEDPAEYFSKLLWVMSTHISEVTIDNADKLEDTLLDCENHFSDSSQFEEIYDLISKKLKDAILNGISDELNDVELVLSIIVEKLKVYAPTLIYGGPVDESGEEDTFAKFKNLPLKTKLKYAAIGSLMMVSLGLAGRSDSEIDKIKDMTDEEYYTKFYDECFEKNPELLGELKKEKDEDTFHQDREGLSVGPDGENNVPRLSDDLDEKTADFEISKDGIEYIKNIETLKLKPYFPTIRERDKYTGRKDNLGKTIGYGHVITEKDDDLLYVTEITESRANELLIEDCKNSSESLKRDIKLLPEYLQNPNLYSKGFVDGMCSFIFNIGNGNFLNKSKTWETWKKCRIDKATGKIREDDYNWLCTVMRSDFVIDSGHISRRKAEAKLLSHIVK